MLQCCVWVMRFVNDTCLLRLVSLNYHSGDADLVTKAEDEWVSHQEEVSDSDGEVSEVIGDNEEISDQEETEKSGSRGKLLTVKYSSLCLSLSLL